MEDTCVIITAKYGSTRLPNKVLYDLGGKTMLERTIDQVLKSRNFDRNNIFLMVDHEKIRKTIDGVLPTGNIINFDTENSENALDCISKYCNHIPSKYKHFISIHADEPSIDPRNIDFLIDEYKKNQCATVLYRQLHGNNVIKCENHPKLVCNMNDEIMYISRTTLPVTKYVKLNNNYSYRIIVGTLALSRQDVDKYKMPAMLYKIEDIEELKLLELSIKMCGALAPYETGFSIDTTNDLKMISVKFNS